MSIRLHEIEGYLEDIWDAQEDTEVVLRTGFEVSYLPGDERLIARVLDEYDLDFVIGSVHEVKGVKKAVEKSGKKIFSRGVSEEVDRYFERFRMGVETGLFDVMGHPDYFRKAVNQEISWYSYGIVVYDAIDALKSHGVGFEVNTSGYYHGVGDKFPRDEFIEVALDAGIKTVTLGSDSHRVCNLGFRLLNTAKALEGLGLDKLTTFCGRREEKILISKIL
jgi:histidinol-phosphatase (PHP family)